MKRRTFVAAAGLVALAGCQGSDDGEGDQAEGEDSDDGAQQGEGEPEPTPAEAVVEQFYRDLDENPDTDRIQALFHSQSPSARYWAGVFSDAEADGGSTIVETTTTLAVEDPDQADIEAFLGFDLDEEVVSTIVQIVEDAPDAAIVEATLTIDQPGEEAGETDQTDIRVVATEDSEWRIVW